MKYMLLIHHDEKEYFSRAEAERQKVMAEYTELVGQLGSSCLAGAPLHEASTARSVRIKDGKRLITDGPFAETREELGGYFLVDAKDLDEAIGIAARIPAARWGTVEVRPLVDVRVPASA